MSKRNSIDVAAVRMFTDALSEWFFSVVDFITDCAQHIIFIAIDFIVVRTTIEIVIADSIELIATMSERKSAASIGEPLRHTIS